MAGDTHSYTWQRTDATVPNFCSISYIVRIADQVKKRLTHHCPAHASRSMFASVLLIYTVLIVSSKWSLWSATGPILFHHPSQEQTWAHSWQEFPFMSGKKLMCSPNDLFPLSTPKSPRKGHNKYKSSTIEFPNYKSSPTLNLNYVSLDMASNASNIFKKLLFLNSSRHR